MTTATARFLAPYYINTHTQKIKLSSNFRIGSTSARGYFSMSTSEIDPEFESSKTVSGEEWQAWGTSSPLPLSVSDVVKNLKLLEIDFNQEMDFGGTGGKLKGDFKAKEDKKHRAVYELLNDSEEKLQFFSARQIACRLLGSRGYLCQKCWLPTEDCMCSKLVSSHLWHGIRFWLYMHPKDFLRQNNTGKLLWQIFGVEAASLCIFGIPEQEEIMWNSFKQSGKSRVSVLYPNRNASPKSLQDVLGSSAVNSESHTMETVEKPLNVILIDGTWSNSAAMHRRLKEKWASLWGGEDLPCISLSTTGASVMHKLRPQPSWDRTCTAAAAAGVLSELSYHYPELSSHGLDKQAEAIENGLDVLLEALTARRIRRGRSTMRKPRIQQLCL